jgi:hypothetical protein
MNREELQALKVDEKLLDDPTLKEAKDVPSALKMLVDTKAFVGRSIRIPSENASEADRAAFRADLTSKIPTLVDLSEPEKVEETVFEKLGRPKDKTGYPAIKDIVKDLPAEIAINEDDLRARASKLGFTKKQYAAFIQEIAAERVKEHGINTEKKAALKKELGDAYADRLVDAAAVAKKFGRSDEYVAKVRAGAVDVEDVKSWLGISKAVGGEGKGIGGTPESGSGRLTPEEAQLQIAELRKNPALNEPSNPGHSAAVAKLYQLNKAAYPEEQ